MKTKSVWVAIFSVFSVSLYPILFLYLNNLGKIHINEIIGIAGIVSLGGFVLLVVNSFIFKSSGKGALITNVIMCFFLYFALIEKVIVNVFPMLYYWHIALICLFVLAHLYYLVYRKMPSNTAKQINQGFLIIFTGLIIYNGTVNIPSAVKTATQNEQQANQNQYIQSDLVVHSPIKDMPNVYYFIFDEYGGYDNILRYCNFDNIDFYNSLEDLGFITSKHSQNGSIDTFTEIPNLLQLQEVNKLEMPLNQKQENFKNPYLFILMKKNGYFINLGSPNELILDHSYADYQITSEFISTFRTFNSFIINNTVFYPLYGAKEHDKEINAIYKMFAYGEESSRIRISNLFTIGYFDFPHIPYVVDEKGNKTDDADQDNLQDPNLYLAQLKFANHKILQMVSAIINNDPQAIIILQSDHGFRYASHLHFWYNLDIYDLQAEAPFEQNILNAVYYQGKNLDIEGLSGINTLKIVLNTLLDAGLEINK